MTDETAAPATGAEQPSIVPIQAPEGTDNFSPRAAANALIAARQKRTEPEATPAKAPEPVKATESDEREPPKEATASEDGAEPEAPRAETETPDPADQPPIEPPRSWTKEDKELFRSLPRETQERVADRERSRESDFLKRQNEATERGKALDAERQKVEQARTQYETALPALLTALQEQQAGEFGDVKSVADIEKLARENWPRYVQWDAQQKKIAAVTQEVNAAQQRQHQEKQTKLAEFIKRESELFKDKVPEIADEAQRTKLQNDAVSVLHDRGFTDEELGAMWRGDKELSLHDHRLQLLIRDAILHRNAEAGRKAAVAVPKPPVQRPGTARNAGDDTERRSADLLKRIDQATNPNQGAKLAARLLMERRQAGRAN